MSIAALTVLVIVELPLLTVWCCQWADRNPQLSRRMA